MRFIELGEENNANFENYWEIGINWQNAKKLLMIKLLHDILYSV